MPSINLTEVERLQAIIAMKDAEIERLSRLNTNIAPPKWDKTVNCKRLIQLNIK